MVMWTLLTKHYYYVYVQSRVIPWKPTLHGLLIILPDADAFNSFPFSSTWITAGDPSSACLWSLFSDWFVSVLFSDFLQSLSLSPSDCSRTTSAILWGVSNSFCFILSKTSSFFKEFLDFLLSNLFRFPFSHWKNFTTWSQPRTNFGRLLNNLKKKNRHEVIIMHTVKTKWINQVPSIFQFVR